MNIILSAIRNSPPLTCAWVPTGDPRIPLACVWKEASAFVLGRTDQSSLEDDMGGLGSAPKARPIRASTTAARVSKERYYNWHTRKGLCFARDVQHIDSRLQVNKSTCW
jgi:hypothetical protein